MNKKTGVKMSEQTLLRQAPHHDTILRDLVMINKICINFSQIDTMNKSLRFCDRKNTDKFFRMIRCFREFAINHR